MATVATNTFAGDLFSASNTVSGIPIGAGFPGRVVVLACLAAGDGVNPTTINGVVADVFNAINIYWAAAVVPTGTTAAIFVSGSAQTEVIGAWSLTGNPSTVPQDVIYGLDGGDGLPINVANGQCALGWTVSAVDPPGTIGTFTATLTDDGAAFDTNAAGPFGNRGARVGSANISSGGGSLTVTVSGYGPPFWNLSLVSYGGLPPPPDTSLVGPIWIETRCG